VWSRQPPSSITHAQTGWCCCPRVSQMTYRLICGTFRRLWTLRSSNALVSLPSTVMATPSVRDSFSADPASLTPEQKKELITRNLEVGTFWEVFCSGVGQTGWHDNLSAQVVVSRGQTLFCIRGKSMGHGRRAVCRPTPWSVYQSQHSIQSRDT